MRKKIKVIMAAGLLVVMFFTSSCGLKGSDEKSKETVSENNSSSQQQSAQNTESTSSSKEVAAFSAVSNYISSKANGYNQYSLLHPQLSLEDVVTQVNIGLDYPYYTNTQVVQNADDILVLCNKYNALPENYEPSDLVEITAANSAASGIKLRKEAAEAFDKLCAAAKKDGYTILGASAYRSYTYQIKLYNNYVASDGKEAADKYSARPGFSEHQTGLAVDVKNPNTAYDRFGSTPDYQWAKDNIYKYGFIIRYEPNKVDITGYQSEEWHFRYVGVSTATAIHDQGITLDEYYAKYLMK